MAEPVFESFDVDVSKIKQVSPARESFDVDPAGITKVSTESFDVDPEEIRRVHTPDSVLKMPLETLAADKKFHPAEFGAEVPDEQMTPELLRKLAMVKRSKDLEGLHAGEVISTAVKNIPETGKSIVKGAAGTMSRVTQGIFGTTSTDPLVKKVFGSNSVSNDQRTQMKIAIKYGDASPEKKAEMQQALDIVEGKAVKNQAELVASSETGARTTAGLARSLGTKTIDAIADAVPGALKTKDLPDTEWENRLLGDIELSRKEKAAATGRGTLSKAFSLDADSLKAAGIELDPAAISEMSFFTDPTTLIGVGYVFKGGKYLIQAGGKTLGTALSEGAAKTFVDAAKKSAETALKATGGAVKATGRGIQAAGKALKATQAGPVTGVLLDRAFGGSGVTGAIAGATGPKILKGVGKAVENTGKVIAGDVQPGRIAGFIKGAAVNPVTKGAVAGAATSLPFVAAARNDEEAGNFLGMGILLGASGSALKSTVKKGSDVVANTAWKPAQVAPVDSPGYGTNTSWDSAHTEQMAKLEKRRPNEVNAVNRLREFLRGEGVEIYMLPENVYDTLPVGAADSAALKNSAGVFLGPESGYEVKASDGGESSNKRLLFLRGDATAAFHEPGHIFQALMPPEVREKFNQQISESFGPDKIEAFKQDYESRINGKTKPEDPGYARLTPERTVEELGAEIISGVLRGDKLSGESGGVVKGAAKLLGGILEGAGIYTPEVNQAQGPAAVTPGGVKQSFPAAKVFEDYLKDYRTEQTPILQAAPQDTPQVAPVDFSEPAPAVPGVPTNVEPQRSATTPAVIFNEPTPATPGAIPTPVRGTPQTVEEQRQREIRNIRVTPADQDRFNQPADDSRGISEARAAVANASPEVKQTFMDLATHIDQPQGEIVPVRIESKTVNAEGFNTGRGTRRAEQSEAYIAEANGALPDSVREMTQKMLVPYRFVTRGENVNVLGMSLDKVIANQYRLVKDAAGKKAADLIPYENSDGALTENGLRDLVEDTVVYTQNQANGFAGNGQRVTIPDNYNGMVPPENPNFSPVALDDRKANFVNTLMGLNPPKTNKVARKGNVPANVAARTLAEANQKPTLPSVTSTPEKSFFKDFGVEIAEFNPLRDELAKRGVDIRDLIEVTEELSLENIETVTPKPESRFRAPSTDLIRAGFMPKEPSKPLREFERDYNKTFGLPYKEREKQADVDPKLSAEIADWYENAKNDPEAPEVKASYDALKSELLQQAEQLRDAGYTVDLWQKSGEPYKNSAEAIADVRDNQHLFVLPTEGNFEGAKSNPLLEVTKLKTSDGIPLLYNDVFRWVHDILGHAKEGNEFGPKGEFNAWQDHAKMFSDEAQPALAAETLAQNSWVNYGKHLRDASGKIPAKGEQGFVPAAKRPFAEQKNVAVPQEMIQRAKSQAGFMPATEAVENIFRHKNTESELTKIRSGKIDGQTFNIDGSVFEPGDSKLDVVTLASENIPASEATANRVQKFLSKYPESLLENRSVKPGLFKLSRTTADGKPMVSLDLNVLVPQEHRANTTEFARQNNQEAIFDLVNFENVATGGNGETVLKSPEQIASAAEKLAAGEPVEFEKEGASFMPAPDDNLKPVKAKFNVHMDGFGSIPGFDLYTLEEDLGGQFKKGNTYSTDTLKKAGFVPEQIAKPESGAKFSPKPKKENAPTFFSKLQQVVEQKFPNSGSVEQLRNIVDPAKGNGVKAEEIKWTGLDDWMKERSGNVTKQEVLGFLKENAVEVRETKVGETFLGLRENPEESDYAGEPMFDVVDSQNGFTRYTGTSESAREYIEENAASEGPKFSKWQLPGGDNYKELLFTLPLATDKPLTKLPDGWTITPLAKNGKRVPENGYGVYSDKNILMVEGNTAEEAKSRGLAYAKEHYDPRKKESFDSKHWENKNVLAHTRFNDRTSTDGKKVLFVEEIQSDWHQLGRKEGYQSGDLTALGKRQKEIQDGLRKLLLAAKEKDPLKNSVDLYKENPEFKSLQDELASVNTQIVKHKGSVPDAPFKTSWHEMVFKRLLRYAAENGYDKLAWTTGEQQADRYDLRKQVNSVAYNRGTGEHSSEYGLRVEGKNGETIHEKSYKADELEDVIGKELAAKIIAGEGTETKVELSNGDVVPMKQFTGLDLKVGGKGMIGFYDKMLPDFARKYGKKWNATVGETEIPGNHDASGNEPFESREKAIQTLDAGGEIYATFTGHNEELVRSYSELLELEKENDGWAKHYVLGDKQPKLKVHSIDITPEMRKSVLEEGQPLFMPKRKKSSLPPTDKFSNRAKAWIAPDGEFLPLKGKLHEDYLLDNADTLKDRFKLDLKKAKKGDEDSSRLPALNKGFVRVNYEQNGGLLTVELNQRFLGRSTKDKIMEVVTDNIDDIDKIRVSLLTDTGETAKSDLATLFNYDTDAEKLDHIPYISEERAGGNTADYTVNPDRFVITPKSSKKPLESYKFPGD